MKSFIKINPSDNVAVALQPLAKGTVIKLDNSTLTLTEEIMQGHKFALKSLKPGDSIIKYGNPVGHATAEISAGSWIHTHNLKTGLGDFLTYTYNKTITELPHREPKFFQGYRRKNGGVGVRNEIWIIPTVGCVNNVASAIERATQKYMTDQIDGVCAFPHPYGCSQMGDDQNNTRQILADLVNHPNAGGVLVLGLGCENSNIDELKKFIGDYDPERVRFLVAQECENEISDGIETVKELISYASSFKREPISASELVIGMKCGGSDGLSGITANPTVGAFSDKLISMGGSTILTEVPEMFGAEELLMNRCETEDLFNQTVALVNDFKNYFKSHNQTIYEKPVKEKGLNLLSAPVNDLVASTALAASGAHIVLFTTGRGTPFASPVPTVKISTNNQLAKKKQNWIDFNCGVMVNDTPLDELSENLLDFVLEIASGKKSKSEEAGFHDMAIFKQGVTL